MPAPKITTAIPQHRYQYGDFAITILGEISSGDGREYEFIAAFVREGESEPQMYVASERLPAGEREKGTHALRLINSAMDEVMEVGSRWSRMSEFREQALKMGEQMLGLEQDTPYPLM